MITSEEIRRINLSTLVAECAPPGDTAKTPGLPRFASKVGKSENQVYQWLQEPGLSSHRNISGESARAIEIACGKEVGWLDHIHNPNLKPGLPAKDMMVLSVKAVRMAVDVYLRPKTLNDFNDEELGTYLFSAYKFITNGPSGGGSGRHFEPESNVFDFGKAQAKAWRKQSGNSPK